MAEEIFQQEFECPNCNKIFNMTSIQKLQHQKGKNCCWILPVRFLKIFFYSPVCKPVESSTADTKEDFRLSDNQKLYECKICFKKLCLTNIEILKHKKSCKIKDEQD